MPRIQLYDPLPNRQPGFVRSATPPVREQAGVAELELEEGLPEQEQLDEALPEPEPAPAPVDCVFATAVLSTNRLLAVFYWARSSGHGFPLILLDFEVGPLESGSWWQLNEQLSRFTAERRPRIGRPLGVWLEGQSLVVQAIASGLAARTVPDHLAVAEAWHPLCQSAAGFLASGMVGYTKYASGKMDSRPFLDAAGVYAGPRTEDPTIAAFLYGVVLALDPASASDPHPKMPVRSRR